MSIRRKPSTPLNENPYQNGDSIIEEEGSYFDDEYFDEFEDTFDETYLEQDELSIPSSDHSRVYPVMCEVIYPYQVDIALPLNDI